MAIHTTTRAVTRSVTRSYSYQHVYTTTDRHYVDDGMGGGHYETSVTTHVETRTETKVEPETFMETVTRYVPDPVPARSIAEESARVINDAQERDVIPDDLSGDQVEAAYQQAIDESIDFVIENEGLDPDEVDRTEIGNTILTEGYEVDVDGQTIVVDADSVNDRTVELLAGDGSFEDDVFETTESEDVVAGEENLADEGEVEEVPLTEEWEIENGDNLWSVAEQWRDENVEALEAAGIDPNATLGDIVQMMRDLNPDLERYIHAGDDLTLPSVDTFVLAREAAMVDPAFAAYNDTVTTPNGQTAAAINQIIDDPQAYLELSGRVSEATALLENANAIRAGATGLELDFYGQPIADAYLDDDGLLVVELPPGEDGEDRDGDGVLDNQVVSFAQLERQSRPLSAEEEAAFQQLNDIVAENPGDLPPIPTGQGFVTVVSTEQSEDLAVPTVTITNPADPTGATYEISIRDLEQMYESAGFDWPPSASDVGEGITTESSSIATADDDTGGCLGAANEYVEGLPPEMQAGTTVHFFSDNDNADGNDAGHVLVQLPSGAFVDPLTGNPVSMDDMGQFFSEMQLASIGLGLPPEVDPTQDPAAEPTGPSGGSEYTYAGNLSGAQMTALIDADPADTAAWNQLIEDLGIRPDQMSLLGMVVADVDPTIVRPEFVEVMEAMRDDRSRPPFSPEVAQVILSGAVVPPGAPTRAEVELLLSETADLWSMDDWERFIRPPEDFGFEISSFEDILEDRFGADRVDAGALSWPPRGQNAASITAGMTNTALNEDVVTTSSGAFYAIRATTRFAEATYTAGALLDTVGVDRARDFVALFPQGDESFSINNFASGYYGEEALDDFLEVAMRQGPNPALNEIASEIELQVAEAGGFAYDRLGSTLGVLQGVLQEWAVADFETTPYSGPTGQGIEEAQAYLATLDDDERLALNQYLLSPAGPRGSTSGNPGGDAPVDEGTWYFVASESGGMPEWSHSAPAGYPYVLAAQDRPNVNYPTGNDIIVVQGEDGPMQLRVGDLQSAILMSSPQDFAYAIPFGDESDAIEGRPAFDDESEVAHPTGNISLIPAVEGGPANVRVQEIAVPVPNRPGEFQFVNVVMPRENGYSEIVPGEQYPGGLSALINEDPTMPVEIFSWGVPGGTPPGGLGPYFNEEGWTTDMPEGFFVWDRNGDSGDLPGSTMAMPPDADAWNTDLYGRPDGSDDRVMYQDPDTGIVYDLGTYQEFQNMVMQGPAAYMPNNTSFSVPDTITINGVETNTAELALGGMNDELPLGGPELMRTLADNGITLEEGVYSEEFMAVAAATDLTPDELDELIHTTQELDGWLEGTEYEETGFDYTAIYDEQATEALEAAGITPEQAIQMTPDELAMAVASPLDPETGENLYLRAQAGEETPFVMLDQEQAMEGQSRAWAFAGAPDQVYSDDFLDLAEEIGVDPNVLAEHLAAQAQLEEVQSDLPATIEVEGGEPITALNLADADDELIYTDEFIELAAAIPTTDEPGLEATVSMDPGDLANFMRYNQPPEWFQELPASAQEAFFAGLPVDPADIPYLSPAHFGQVVDFDGDGVVSDAEIELYGSYQPYGRDYLTEMNTRSYVFQTGASRVADIFPGDPERQEQWLVNLGRAVEMDAENEWGLFTGHPAMVMVNVETILAIGDDWDADLLESFEGDLNRYMSYAMMAEFGELGPGELDPTANLDFTAATGIELPPDAPPFPAAGDQSDVIAWVDELVAMNDPVAAEAAASVLDGMADAMEYASNLDFDQMMEDATHVFGESDNFFLNLVIGGPVGALYPGGPGGLANDTLEAIGHAYVGENPITKSGLDEFQSTVAPSIAQLRAAAERLRTPATEGGYLTPEGTIDPSFSETIAEEIFYGIGAHNAYFALVQPFAFAIGQHGQQVQNTINQHRAFWTQVAIFAAAAPLSGLGVAAANFAGVTSLAGRAAIQIGVGAFGTGFMLGGAEALGQQLGGGVYDWNAVGREFLGGAVAGGSLQAARLVPGFASIAFGGEIPPGAATYILNWSSNTMMGQGLYWSNVIRSGEGADFGDWMMSTLAMGVSGWIPATNMTNMFTPNHIAREVLEENLEEFVEASVQLFNTTGPDGRTYGQMLLDGDISVTDALSNIGRLTPWSQTTLTSLLLAPIGGDVDAPIGDLNSLNSPNGYELLNTNVTVRPGSTVGLAHNPGATITQDGADAVQAINTEIGDIAGVDASGWVPVPGSGDQVQRYFQDPNGVGYVVRVDLTSGQTLRQATTWQGQEIEPGAMVGVTAADSVVANVGGTPGTWQAAGDGSVATREITTENGTFVQTVDMETGAVTLTGVDPTADGWTVSGSAVSYTVDLESGEISAALGDTTLSSTTVSSMSYADAVVGGDQTAGAWAEGPNGDTIVREVTTPDGTYTQTVDVETGTVTIGGARPGPSGAQPGGPLGETQVIEFGQDGAPMVSVGFDPSLDPRVADLTDGIDPALAARITASPEALAPFDDVRPGFLELPVETRETVIAVVAASSPDAQAQVFTDLSVSAETGAQPGAATVDSLTTLRQGSPAVFDTIMADDAARSAVLDAPALSFALAQMDPAILEVVAGDGADELVAMAGSYLRANRDAVMSQALPEVQGGYDFIGEAEQQIALMERSWTQIGTTEDGGAIFDTNGGYYVKGPDGRLSRLPGEFENAPADWDAEGNGDWATSELRTELIVLQTTDPDAAAAIAQSGDLANGIAGLSPRVRTELFETPTVLDPITQSPNREGARALLESEAALQVLLDGNLDSEQVSRIIDQSLILDGLVDLAGRENPAYGVDLANQIISSGQDPAMFAVVADGLRPDGTHNTDYQLWVTVDGRLQSLGIHDGVNGGQIEALANQAHAAEGTPTVTFLHFQDGTGAPSENDHYVGLIINELFAPSEASERVVVNHQIAYVDGAGQLHVEGYTPDPTQTNPIDVDRSLDAIYEDPSFLLPVAGADPTAPRRFVQRHYTGAVTDAFGRQTQVDTDIIAFSAPGADNLTETYRVVGNVPGQDNLVIVSDRWTGDDPLVTGYFDTDTGTFYSVEGRKTDVIVATDGNGRGLVVNRETDTTFQYVSGETVVGQTEDGPITLIEPNFNAGIGETWIVELPDGSRGVFKPERGQVVADHFPTQDHFSEREVLADDFSELFGFDEMVGYDLVPDTEIVELRLDGSGPLRGSVSLFVESEGDIDRFWRRTGTGPQITGDAAETIAVFAYLMGETDAVDRNALLVPDPDNPGAYRPVLIDHGNAFAAIEDQYAGNYWGGRPGEPIPTGVQEHLTELWNQPGFQDQVRTQMEDANIPAFQIDSFFDRWQTLVDDGVFPPQSRDYRTEPEDQPAFLDTDLPPGVADTLEGQPEVVRLLGEHPEAAAIAVTKPELIESFVADPEAAAVALENLQTLATDLNTEIAEALFVNDAVLTGVIASEQLTQDVVEALQDADAEAATLLFTDPSTTEILGTFANRWPDSFLRVLQNAPGILASDPGATVAQAVVVADSVDNPDYQLFATVDGVLTPLGHHQFVTSGTVLELREQGFVEFMHYQPNLEPSGADLEFAALADALLGEAAIHSIVTYDGQAVGQSEDFGTRAPAVDGRVLDAALNDLGFIMPVSNSRLRFPLDRYLGAFESLIEANPNGYVPVQRFGIVDNIAGVFNRNPPTIVQALQNQNIDISGLTTEQLAIMEYRALEAIVIREAAEVYNGFDLSEVARTHTLVPSGATVEQIQRWADQGQIGTIVAHTRLVPRAQAGDQALDLDPAVMAAGVSGNLWSAAMAQATRRNPARRALGHADDALQAAGNRMAAADMINAGFFNMLQIGVAVDRYLETQPGVANDPDLRAEIGRNTIGPLYATMAALPLAQFSSIREIGAVDEVNELFMLPGGVLTLNPAYVQLVNREVDGREYNYVMPVNATRSDRTMFNTKCPALMVKFGSGTSAIHLGASGFLELLAIYGGS